jgi:hypothetical protein
MKGYPSFLKKHKAAKTEAEQLLILKNYLFGLSNAEFAEFLNMGNLVQDVRFILANGTENDKQQIAETLDTMEAVIVRSNTLSAKAA